MIATLHLIDVDASLGARTLEVEADEVIVLTGEPGAEPYRVGQGDVVGAHRLLIVNGRAVVAVEVRGQR